MITARARRAAGPFPEKSNLPGIPSRCSHKAPYLRYLRIKGFLEAGGDMSEWFCPQGARKFKSF